VGDAAAHGPPLTAVGRLAPPPGWRRPRRTTGGRRTMPFGRQTASAASTGAQGDPFGLAKPSPLVATRTVGPFSRAV
jgi:hypothetical protein